MSKLLLTFYGDDFTGSTDALEQLTLAGIRTALFITPPTPKQLSHFHGLQAIGVAGMTRALSPAAMERELKPALQQLKKLGAPHVHYKVCSTFDSSPKIGSIGRAIDIGAAIFHAPFVPVLAAAPALGRYTIFGTHFARYGIGSSGAVHRLDRHPSVSKHPVTPMTEADLRRHLAKQTKKRIALFDVLQLAQPGAEARRAFEKLLAGKPEVVLFDAFDSQHLRSIGTLLQNHASVEHPLFSVGSSGIEAALAATWKSAGTLQDSARLIQNVAPANQIFIGSGSCSPVTGGQIEWALKRGFVEVTLDPVSLLSPDRAVPEMQRAANSAAKQLQAGHSVILHTTKNGSTRRIKMKPGRSTAEILGTALGTTMKAVLKNQLIPRLCIAGGDTSSYAARALGIEALEMIAPLTPGAPLCRVTAPGSPADGLEIVFKGGQVGPENYFEIVKHGKTATEDDRENGG